jgi:beta-glucosidase/6-phospho-beta-glucosidase/beta-galactosidase
MQTKLKKLLEIFLSTKKIILIAMGIISLHTFALDFPEKFLFGVANAPAHVEDQLDDPWMDFAKRGNTKSFLNHTRPDDRLEFWTRPEVEINLASDLGVDVFRLGID